MHWHTQLMCAVVAFAALGGLWRPGSIVLAASWIIGEAVAVQTGNGLPISLYWVLDPLVLYSIWHWRSSLLDWFIMVCFPLQWVTYLWAEGDGQWWLLYWLALAQMVLAGPWPAMQRAMPRVSHGPLRTRNRA